MELSSTLFLSDLCTIFFIQIVHLELSHIGPLKLAKAALHLKDSCCLISACPTWDGCMVVGFCGALASFSASSFISASTMSAMSCLSSAWCSPTRGMAEPTAYGDGDRSTEDTEWKWRTR